MWKLKSMYSHQADKVSELLVDGWEPFSVVSTGQFKDRKPVLKIYFRKNDTTSDLLDPSVINLRRSLNQELADTIAKAVSEGMQKSYTVLEAVEPSAKIAHAEPIEVTEIDLSDLIPDDENEENEDKEETESEPVGNGFRTVDNIPPEAKPRAHTTDQDEAIKEIRKKEKVNLTINPVDKDGNVTVLARSKIFIVRADGAYALKKSEAKTGASEGA